VGSSAILRRRLFVEAAWYRETGSLPKQFLVSAARFVMADERLDLIKQVFQVLNQSGSGRVNAEEFRPYAEFLGFEGEDEDWNEEWSGLVAAYGWDANLGPDEGQFVAAVQDAEGNCFAETEDLTNLLDEAEGESDDDDQEFDANPSLGAVSSFAWATSEKSRPQLVSKLFSVLDADGDGKISCQEMLRFARAMDYPNPDDAWPEDFRAMFPETDPQGENQVGPDLESFTNMMNDEEGDMYCEYEELVDMIERFDPQQGDGKRRSSRKSISSSSRASRQSFSRSSQKSRSSLSDTSRPALIKKLFDLLQSAGSGFINKSEMLAFARMMEYPGDDDEWGPEFSDMCEANGCDDAVGFNLAAFSSLLNDEDGDLYCEDAQITDFVEELVRKSGGTALQKEGGRVSTQPVERRSKGSAQIAAPREPAAAGKTEQAVKIAEAAPPTRSELLRNLFQKLDVDGDRVLNQAELLRYARLVGFPGDEEEWEEEYEGVCEDTKSRPAVGLTLEAFLVVVDEKESDYYSEDAQVKSMINVLEEEQKIQRKADRKATSREDRKTQYGTRAQVANTKEDRAATVIQSCHRGNMGRETAVAQKAGVTYEKCSCGRPFGDLDVKCRDCDTKRPPKEMVDKASRSVLTKELFRALDQDNDKSLNKAELLPFARHCEFNGNEEEWADEFEYLCEDYGWDLRQGADLPGFVKCVNDVDGFCYCTDKELSALQVERVKAKGQGPMIDQMTALLPRGVNLENQSRAFRDASLTGMEKQLEDSGVPQAGKMITADSASDALSKLQEKHKDTQRLSAQQVAAEMTDITQQLRTYTKDRSNAADDEESSESATSLEEENDDENDFLPTCRCGYEFSIGQRFCRRCGSERQTLQRCPNCRQIVGVNDSECVKCGTPIERQEEEKFDICGDCGHPFQPLDRFCRKCQAERPSSQDQCECGQFFANAEETRCSACGKARYEEDEEEDENQKLLSKEEKERRKSEKKAEKKERQVAKQLAMAQAAQQKKERQQERLEVRRRQSVEVDTKRQVESDKQKKEAAAEQKKVIESANKLPPGVLSRAITQCDESVAIAVINHPAFTEVHTRDARGCSTLHCAAERGLTIVCKSLLLLPIFKDAGVKDNEGWTALHRAARNGHQATVKILAAHPALTNRGAAIGRDGFTALHCAAMHGFAAVARVLMDHPKFNEANYVDRWGRTALHCAAEYGRVEVVKLLLEHPRFTNELAKTKWGTIAEHAASGKTKETFEKAKRAETNKPEDRKRTSTVFKVSNAMAAALYGN